jgi:hypothetical protein
MAVYATENELRSYVEDNSSVTLPNSTAIERLLERAERRVDVLIRPRAVDPVTGLKYVPAA